jgi:hypothetical protein
MSRSPLLARGPPLPSEATSDWHKCPFEIDREQPRQASSVEMSSPASRTRRRAVPRASRRKLGWEGIVRRPSQLIPACPKRRSTDDGSPLADRPAAQAGVWPKNGRNEIGRCHSTGRATKANLKTLGIAIWPIAVLLCPVVMPVAASRRTCRRCRSHLCQSLSTCLHRF